jgi:uncharacterized membrane protein YedE/YeeE
VALYLLGSGQVAGISGIVGGALGEALSAEPDRGDGRRWSFIIGLLVAPWVWWFFADQPELDKGPGMWALLGAGLLVGFGSRLGNGCTSGHGVCGLSRFSLRSLVHVLIFMAAGAAVVYWLRELLPALQQALQEALKR